jgi:pyruvate kinase
MHIIATVSAVGDDDFYALVEAGLDSVRIVAKGRPAEETAALVRAALRLRDEGVLSGVVWLDIPGVRPRVGRLNDSRLVPGELVEIADEKVAENTGIGVLNLTRHLPGIQCGAQVWIADGTIRLVVVDKSEANLICRVDRAGRLTRGRSVSIEGLDSRYYFGVTEDDLRIIRSLDDEERVEYTVSWVSTAPQLREMFRVVPPEWVIPKLESDIADADLEDIAGQPVAGILVGRSDLYAGLGAEAASDAVRRYVDAATAKKKKAYVGSRILDSLEYDTQPARADLDDLRSLLSLGLTGLLVGGSSGNDAKLRKISHIRHELT